MSFLKCINGGVFTSDCINLNNNLKRIKNEKREQRKKSNYHDPPEENSDKESFGLENLYLEIPFERLGTFKRQFLIRLEDFSANNKRENNVSLLERRLDALARLLESDLTCVAVTLDACVGECYVFSNKKMKNDNIIDELLNALNKEEIDVTTQELLASLIFKKLYQNLAQYDLRDKSKEEKKTLKSELKVLVYEFIEEALKYRHMASIMELLNSNAITISKFRIDKKIGDKALIVTLRLVRDFLKLHSLMLDGVAEELSAAICKKKLFILQSDGFEEHFNKLHAEIKAIHNECYEPKNDYIGISKLSCGHCALYISGLNELGYNIGNRGNHSTVKGMWPLSGFLKAHQDVFEIFVGERAYATFVGMTLQERNECYDFIRDVGSKRCTKDDRNDIRGNKKPSPIKTLVKIPPNKKTTPLEADFSDSDEEQDYKCYDFNHRTAEILEFKKMLSTINHEELESIKCFLKKHDLRYEDGALSKLCNIYTLSPEEFWTLIEDKEEIMLESFSAICDLLIRNLQQNKEYRARDSDYEDYDYSAYAEIKDQIDEDHDCWDYAYNSDDSQNRWVYESDW